jgi:hypothetical protein
MKAGELHQLFTIPAGVQAGRPPACPAPALPPNFSPASVTFDGSSVTFSVTHNHTYRGSPGGGREGVGGVKTTPPHLKFIFQSKNQLLNSS